MQNILCHQSLTEVQIQAISQFCFNQNGVDEQLITGFIDEYKKLINKNSNLQENLKARLSTIFRSAIENFAQISSLNMLFQYICFINKNEFDLSQDIDKKKVATVFFSGISSAKTQKEIENLVIL